MPTHMGYANPETLLTHISKYMINFNFFFIKKKNLRNTMVFIKIPQVKTNKFDLKKQKEQWYK